MVKNLFNSLVVGLGSIGNRHTKNLMSLGFKNISIFRTFKNKTKYPKINNIEIFSNFDKAINKKKYDLMILANPTSEHIKYAIKGAKKKINIYIEKPLSNTLKNTQILQRIEKKNKIKILIGCQLRYHAGLIYVKKVIEKKKLGKIYSVFCDVGEHLPLWHPKENFKKSYAAKKKLGGGVILTLIHEIDYLYWLFGKFKSVYAAGGSLTKLNINVEDTVLGNITTKENIPILLRMDYWRNPPSRQLNIVGEKGQLNWDYYSKKVTIIYNNGKKIVKKMPKNWNRNVMFIDIMRDFLSNIQKNKKVKIPLKDGIYTLKVALALKKSLTKSKKILI
tara:strand:- start:1465 stop:2466 length:1002 start_codon:yes stop_codon:yes gene_type:complete